jgi:UvrB/UvrC motif-containing protein
LPFFGARSREIVRLSQDIQRLLDDWEFDPDQLQVRFITGDDGREKIQMRIDLGVIQLELSGRPDGERPEGHESLLEYYESKAQEAIESSSAFALSPEDCSRLMREGLQYYHRYLSAFHLERYELVAFDTLRNLRLFAFVGRHAARQRDKIEFDKYRPYVQMMHTRATASLAIKEGDHRAALGLIDAGIKAIRRFLREYKQEEREHECPELRSLLNWRREVKRERPMEPLEQLEQQLELSVVREDYEEAARLRDQIRRLRAGLPQ